MTTADTALDVAIGAAGAAGLLFLITKTESIHLGRVLGARSIPEPAGRRVLVGKLAMGGGVLSALLVAGAFPLSASVRPRLERDLGVSTDDGAWSGGRRASEWAFFKDDTAARSQWIHARTGARLTVFAHPQGLLHDQAEFHRDYSAEMGKQVTKTLVDDENVPAPFRGFRYVAVMKTKTGDQVALVAYLAGRATRGCRGGRGAGSGLPAPCAVHRRDRARALAIRPGSSVAPCFSACRRRPRAA